jgi:hypothetical protein
MSIVRRSAKQGNVKTSTRPLRLEEDIGAVDVDLARGNSDQPYAPANAPIMCRL